MRLTKQISHQTTSLPGMNIDFDAMECLSIFEPSQQVGIVTRPNNPRISAYLQQFSNQLSAGSRLTTRQKETMPALLDRQLRLPEGIGKQDLLADICLLVKLYADLMDCPSVGIRLEVLKHAMCPKFHIDRTGIRLLCTYLGPGTEWLDEAFCNRNAFASTHPTDEIFNQSLVLHPQGIRQAPEQVLVLLKGSLWQGNQHGGAIHRSPQIAETTTRVVLALDAIW
ncbi:DUF1826 domain-containing protein [Methylophilus sp. Leaf414]|uniref:DUF1826 domain-containing protein n=1 Tax=Methylophilus sp. Leaf414 TaxID=1736371 RepID=UPI0006FE4B87|nr:DUF1826 domain-containing protein [Methylophilus sp. Leaf414]KQT34367.1 hypothetical protein ASG24_11635 [Methylophilus sp. Leaf414]